MGTRRKKSRRRCAASNRHYSLIGSCYARRLHVEALEDRRLLAVFSVDNLSDGGAGSLRQAILDANAVGSADEITFAVSGTINIASQLPTITDDLTITGPGADLLAIDAGSTTTPLMGDGFRIFEINDGTAGLIDVSLSGLTLTGADVPHAPPSGSFSGGAIFNFETLTIDRTSIVANRARFGGGISQVTTASTTITNSTLFGNVASQNGGGVSSAGVFTATNVTISNNSADGGGGIILGAGTGDPSATLNLINSTVTGNTATNGSHGILFFSTYGPTTATLDHTIVNDAVVGIGGAPTLSGNYNLFANADPGITGTNNQFSTDPLLGPLQDNGGPTDTHALLLGSPAIDAGDPSIVFNATEFDQRGAPFARVLGNAIDIGAYEVQPVTQIVSTTDDVSDDDFSPGNLSLREAINQANTNPGADTITFSSLFDTTQTIALTSQLPTITDDLTITGPGQTLLTLDAGNGTDDTFDTGDGFRILEIDNGDNVNLIDVEISGLTLTGGDVSGSFPGDPAGRGGAIHNRENLTLTASTISGNATSGGSDFGGGIYHSQYAGTLDVSATTISGNTSSGGGGGIRNHSTALVSITSSTISGNTGSKGGGISSYEVGMVTLTSSTVSGNISSGRGGGIYTYEGAVTLTSSTVSGNTSSSFGGGIYMYGGAVTLTSSTVSGNTSNNDGGGIYTSDGDVTIQNSIVAGNMAGGSGPDLFLSGSTLTINHSLIGVTDGLTIIGNVGNQTGTAASPLNPLLGPLADNGGPTLPSGAVNQTHALLPGSPALDAIISLASGGAITQTTTHTASFPATNAVDGDLGTFSHTAVNDTNPHWQHNPAGGGRVYQIILHNRQDGSQERLRDIRIEIFNGAEEVIFDSGLLNPNNVLISPAKIVVDVAALNGGAPVIGPFIRVSREPDPNGTNDADKNVLSLAEVEIVSTAPGAPLFDQRGKLRIRDGGGGGDELARIDIGAYEAQAAPSADFDTDGDVDGADFLAWQRGFGKANAQRADGNSDDDNDTDASDLAAWAVSFGQPQPAPLAATSSENFANQIDRESLIDAVMALEWLGSDSDEETSYVAEPETVATLFTAGNEPTAPASAVNVSREIDVVRSSPNDSDDDQPWLTDELLQRVFG